MHQLPLFLFLLLFVFNFPAPVPLSVSAFFPGPALCLSLHLSLVLVLDPIYIVTPVLFQEVALFVHAFLILPLSSRRWRETDG